MSMEHEEEDSEGVSTDSSSRPQLYQSRHRPPALSLLQDDGGVFCEAERHPGAGRGRKTRGSPHPNKTENDSTLIASKCSTSCFSAFFARKEAGRAKDDAHESTMRAENDLMSSQDVEMTLILALDYRCRYVRVP